MFSVAKTPFWITENTVFEEQIDYDYIEKRL